VSAYLYALGSLAVAALVAAAALGRRRSVPRAVSRAVDGLRAVHDGRPGDYVAWTVLGAAVLSGLSALLVR
jgi:hypothetical protein